MTAQHKKQAQQRIQARQGFDSIWIFAAILVVATLFFTLLGWMDWSDERPRVNVTAPVGIQQAVESGGLVTQ